MYQKIKGVFEKIQGFVLALIGIALGLIMCIVLLQTFTRYILFYSLPWSEELSRYIFVFLMMFGLNVAIKEDMLIRIDLIDYAIKGRASGIFYLLRNLAGLAVCIIIAYSSTSLFKVGMIQKSPAMLIPMVYIYAFVCGGFIVSAIAMVFKVIDAAILLASPKTEDGGTVA